MEIAVGTSASYLKFQSPVERGGYYNAPGPREFWLATQWFQSPSEWGVGTTTRHCGEIGIRVGLRNFNPLLSGADTATGVALHPQARAVQLISIPC